MIELVRPGVELRHLVVVLVWPLDVFDIDRLELVVVVRARFALRVLHDAQLVFQFIDFGHEVLDHRGLVLLKFLITDMRILLVFRTRSGRRRHRSATMFEC